MMCFDLIGQKEVSISHIKPCTSLVVTVHHLKPNCFSVFGVLVLHMGVRLSLIGSPLIQRTSNQKKDGSACCMYTELC